MMRKAISISFNDSLKADANMLNLLNEKENVSEYIKNLIYKDAFDADYLEEVTYENIEKFKHPKKLKNGKYSFRNTRFYSIWILMRQRCFNEKASYYEMYGGRGITVCERWLTFDKFKEDMYDTYYKHAMKYGEKQTTLERINVDGNYDPNNCVWATYKTQNKNRRTL